uniref:Uncharacterized protein n=1 Tax=mine drainage metagenome TaxID=410659 RepID=E6QKM4_9ZZZZ
MVEQYPALQAPDKHQGSQQQHRHCNQCRGVHGRRDRKFPDLASNFRGKRIKTSHRLQPCSEFFGCSAQARTVLQAMFYHLEKLFHRTGLIPTFLHSSSIWTRKFADSFPDTCFF